MNVIKFTGLSLLVALLTCCKGDGTLLDLYPIDPIVNPEAHLLIRDNGIIHTQLSGRNRITGVTEKGGFTADDRFNAFSFQPYAWPEDQRAVGFGRDLVVQAPMDGRSFALRYSRDNGQSWTTFDKAIVDEADAILGEVYPVSVLVGDDEVVWLLCQQHIGAGRRAMLYRIDLVNGTSEALLKKMHALALAVDFVDRHHGWLLWADPAGPQGNIHLLKTTDGGRVWSGGAVLDNIIQPSIEAISDDKLLIYGQADNAFLSADGGATVEPILTGMGRIQACQAVSAEVIYMLSVGSAVGKSTDGGVTWLPLEAQARGIGVTGTDLHFYDERQGIVYDRDRLFVTHDGGAGWEVLVYPYEYVVEQ
ncbi:WD40/YVTN/BNR-like repeat-containing protein [Parapedobacter sp. DT-150]|uniref:WD40/YVTN/BNR-like repeat-containing protein n=1 Tax=Parapedobacter sp. DT-150 TaxID=3396162 RepID=UPI003F1CBF24